MTKSFVYIEMSPEISAEELVAEFDMKLTMTSEDGRPTCRHCSRYLHVGQKCSDVKKAITGSVNSRLTLADIVLGVNPSTEEKQNTETLPAPPPLMPRPSLPIETLNEEQLLADEEAPAIPEVVPEQEIKGDSTFPELDFAGDENYEISSDEDTKMQTDEAESEADSAEDTTAGKKRPARPKPQKKSKRLSGSKSKSGSSK
ncbi:hypothetical protein pipiens_010846 [Culex pipiens pipiens]|uniref:Uncharacterized protein n=1 Tax=Culex pipiens pipiens TaxID=38569 RepID=A0ABD1DA77_CULPP